MEINMSEQTIIRMDHIIKRFYIDQPNELEILHGISLSVKKGEFTINTENRRLFILDQEINVTSKEFDMLLLLVTNPGKVYSRDELLRAIWGEDYPGDARTVDVHIRRLREKIEPNASEPKYVHTKWGVGYYYQQV